MAESGNELRDFRIALVENLIRKNLSDPEEAAAIKEYDELKRKLEGEKPRGNPNLSQRNKLEGWTQAQTAKDLGISQPAFAKNRQFFYFSYPNLKPISPCLIFSASCLYPPSFYFPSIRQEGVKIMYYMFLLF